MKLVIATCVLGALIIVSGAGSEPRASCIFGRVQGFVSLRAEPIFLVGTIPARESSNPKYFSRRFNCKRNTPTVRRVDDGIYDVQFPGLNWRTAFVTAISQEGVSASVTVDKDMYRVALRGPLVIDNALVRRDVAFSISVF